MNPDAPPITFERVYEAFVKSFDQVIAKIDPDGGMPAAQRNLLVWIYWIGVDAACAAFEAVPLTTVKEAVSMHVAVEEIDIIRNESAAAPPGGEACA